MEFRDTERDLVIHDYADDHELGTGTECHPRHCPETAGGCNYSGCTCDGFYGNDALCGNCHHNSDFHW